MKKYQKIQEGLGRSETLLLLGLPLVLMAVLAHFFAGSLILSIVTYFYISLSMVLGLQVFMGNSGILAWTHIGFVGIGAYMSSIFSLAPRVKALAVPNMYEALVAIQMPTPLAIVLGALVAALLAALVAWPFMRLSDAVAVITIYAALIVIHVVMTQWDNVTNGPRTFFGVERFTSLWVALIGALITLIIVFYFRDSALGLKLRASRDDRYAAYSIGINVVLVRYLTFVLSAFLAGLAGGLWAHFITSFSPKSFYMTEAFTLLSMLIIGGAGSVSGALVGTAIVTLTRELLRQVEGSLNNLGLGGFEFFGLTEIVLAIAMISFLIWRPDGLVGGQEIRLPRFWKKDHGTVDDQVQGTETG